jgi:hypothetical protein
MLAIRVAGVADDNHGNHVNSLNSDAEPHQHSSAERISLNFQPFDAFTLSAGCPQQPPTRLLLLS